MKEELGRGRQTKRGGSWRRGSKWDREILGVVPSPTPRFWGRSHRPEAKTGALSGNQEGMNFSAWPTSP